MTDFTVEVLTDWDKTIHIKEEWNELNLQSNPTHPFSCYEFFDCWYRAYCRPGEARIILTRDGQKIKVIIPGLLSKEKIKGISINLFTCAANWYSPRFSIIAAPADLETFLLNLEFISVKLPEKVHLFKLWMVRTGSKVDKIVKDSELPQVAFYCEHQIECPDFDLSDGWDSYFQSRSKKIRYRFRQAEKRAKSQGELGFEIFSVHDDLHSILPRLKSLDAKTWQHKNGSGLFSTIENETFYEGLLLNYSKVAKVIVAFLTIGNRDAAYELSVIDGIQAFFLKYGYDPVFSDCRPGVLVQSYLTRHLSSLGVQKVDLGLEPSEEKAHWQTNTSEYHNYWLIRKNTLKGRGLLAGIQFKEMINKPKRNQEQKSTSILTAGN